MRRFLEIGAARRSRARRLGAWALLGLLFCACHRAPDPPLLIDQVPLLPGPQAQRIEQDLNTLREQEGLSLYIRIRPASPKGSAQPEDLPRRKDDAIAIEIYPLSRELRYRHLGEGEGFGRLPQHWERDLKRALEQAFAAPERIGDRIELALRELASARDVAPPPAGAEAETEEGPATHVETQRFERGPPSLPSPPLRGDPGPQGEPERAYALYLALARDGQKSPHLSLYTEETRAFFLKHPITKNQLARVYAKYAGVPYELVTHGPRAVIDYPNRDLTFAPFFLRHDPAGWRLDFATIAKVIRTSVRKLWHFSQKEHAYGFAFEGYLIDEDGYVHYRERAR